MKKFIGLVGVIISLFVIIGCGGGGGVDVNKYLNITEDNSQKVSKEGVETVDLNNPFNDLQYLISDIVQDATQDQPDRIIAGGSTTNSAVVTCQDDGNITIKYQENINEKHVEFVANKCSENGIYLNGNVNIDRKDLNDANGTQEIILTFKNFIYKKADDTISLTSAKLYIKKVNSNIKAKQVYKYKPTKMVIQENIDITGYIKDSDKKVEFDNFKYIGKLIDSYLFITVNGNIKFSTLGKWIKIETLKDVKVLNNSNDCPIAGEMKISGASSYVLIKFNSDQTVSILYNGKVEVCHKNCKNCFETTAK